MKSDIQPIALRITDLNLHSAVQTLANENNLSLNMTANMLIAFAINEIDRQGKKFTPKLIFTVEREAV